MVKISVLDLVPIPEGKTAGEAIQNSVELAKKVEQLGYERYWFAEHHNARSIASSATSVLIGHIAASTSTIRVGSGGIMLPNHVPLVIAEQFGTLAEMFPNRIDLGLGRAPGTDGVTAQALRRNSQSNGQDFPENVVELQNYLKEDGNTYVQAYPGKGTDVPLYLLGSSLFSAQLAGMLGLPYAFASHFAPTYLHQAIAVYRENFRPSEQLQKPYVMACVNGVAANTDQEAQLLSTSLYRYFLGVVRNDREKLQPPMENLQDIWSDMERRHITQTLQYSFIGSLETITEQTTQFIEETAVDELMIVSHIYDQQARQHSYELFAQALLNK